MKKLENKIALITGGNSGIGLATAKLFLEEGARVIITARSTESYEKATSELGSKFDIIKTDVCKNSDLDNLYSQIKTKYNGLDILFANAGIAYFKPTTEVDDSFFDSQFNTNVRGLYFSVQKALSILRPNSSVILNASAVSNKGIAGASVYSATKAAVRSFARSWTNEIPAEKSRFNVLSPGPIETPIYDKMGMPSDQLQGFADHLKTIVPAKRFGSADEMAKVVLFLASSDSSYLYGSDILADGGFANI